MNINKVGYCLIVAWSSIFEGTKYPKTSFSSSYQDLVYGKFKVVLKDLCGDITWCNKPCKARRGGEKFSHIELFATKCKTASFNQIVDFSYIECLTSLRECLFQV